MTIDDQSAETSDFLDGLLTRAIRLQSEMDQTNATTDCMDCGQPIPKERLQLMREVYNTPANCCYCVKCQSEIDKQRRKPIFITASIDEED